MSKGREKDTSSQRPAEEDVAGAGDAAVTQVEPAVSDTGRNAARRRGAGPIAWIALLLAALAAGLASRPFWAQWVTDAGQNVAETARPAMEDFQSLAERLVNTAEKAEQNAQALEQLSRDLAKLDSELKAALNERAARDFSKRADQLAARVERMEGQFNTRLGGVRARVEDLEEQVGRRLEQLELRLVDFGVGLDRADRDLATRLRLVEVDGLFAVAQDRLAVSDNVAVARRAWQRGLERLTALEGPEFSDLKRIARREFERLEAFRAPDTAALVDRLYTIVDEIDQWPAKSSPTSPPNDSGTPSTGWVDRLGEVLDGLVTIESVDVDYLSPAEVDLVRERMQTILQAAALALVRARQDTAQRLIERVLAGAERGFDTDSAIVEASLAWLSRLAARDESEIRVPSLEQSRAEIARLLGGMR